MDGQSLSVWPRAKVLFATGQAQFLHAAFGLPHVPTVSVGRLLVIRRSLHLSQDTFALAQFLEPAHELLDRFVGPWSHFDHAVVIAPFFFSTVTGDADLASSEPGERHNPTL